jgi:hypothetical protein
MSRRETLLAGAGALLLLTGIAIGTLGAAQMPIAVAQQSPTATPGAGGAQTGPDPVTATQVAQLRQEVGELRQEVTTLQQENADVSGEVELLTEETAKLVQATNAISAQMTILAQQTTILADQATILADQTTLVAENTALIAERTAQRTVTAIGYVELKGVPDVAIAQIDIKDEARELSQALPANQARVAATVAQIAGLGVPPDQIQPADPDVAPVLGDDRQINGYRVLTPVLVTVRDPKGSGAPILAAVIKIGGSSFKEIKFSASDPSATEEQARVQAYRLAEARAQSYAAIAGVTLGAIQTVSEDLNVRRFLPLPLPGQPKEQIIAAEVTITYRIVEP